MPGRSFSAANQYRYGFNGKENDNEVKGIGNQIDYDKRIYDPRLGRFYSLDPLQAKFPYYSPYQFAGNTPIQAIDLDGAEEYHYTMLMDKNGNAILTLQSVTYVNHHSFMFWHWDTKIDVKRYVVEFDDLMTNECNTYHIGFAQYGTGYANAWKTDDFENNYLKKTGNAIDFWGNYVDDNHSQAASDVSKVVNTQNWSAETTIPFEEHIPSPVKKTNNTSAAAHGNPKASKANPVEAQASIRPNLTESNVVKGLTGLSPSNVEPILVKAGWTKAMPQANTPNKIQHTVFSKTSSSGAVYTLDFHPGAGNGQTSLHSVAYWKIYYQENANAAKTLLGRITTSGFINYDRIKEPIYIDGTKSNVKQ